MPESMRRHPVVTSSALTSSTQFVSGLRCRECGRSYPAEALARARELGFKVAACASTGNLANSVAAHAARAGMRHVVFIPADLEAGKVVTTAVFGPSLVAVDGSYDDVNRLCTEVASENP